MAYFIVIYAICTVYMALNFKYDLQMFQQNSYRLSRYWHWLNQDHLAGAWRLTDLACFLLLLAPTLLDIRLSSFIVAVVCLTKIFLIIRRKAKKPLVFTARVKRLYALTLLLSVGAVAATAICTAYRDYPVYSPAAFTLALILAITCLSWGVVMLSAWLLTPVEKAIQRHYINDAKRILKSMPGLKVIGITGSYGKTSTKHYLTRILDEHFDVLMTPGSFNTPMGVVRTVREHMKPYNQVFVCEMGAKQPGDIKEICDIVHPEAGIVTAVGPMHLESFKTLENVCHTKFELVDALPAGGFAVVNNDFTSCAQRSVGNVKVARYAVTNPDGAQFRAVDVAYSPQGTDFTVEGPDGLRLPLHTRLLGECNVSDLLAAVVMALHYGVPHNKIQYAVRSIAQVEHRLSIKKTPGGVTIIDDAFNSNPEGSRMALEVLGQFKEGKRIVVTPGMIELGASQEELNHALGTHIGLNADVAVIVGRYNRGSLVAGIKETDFNPDNLHTVEDFNQAQQLLSRILTSGDTVLYENDLPDTFK